LKNEREEKSMKKVFKRFGAFLLASIMMLAMCPVGAFADTATPSAEDKAKITVTDVEAGATVTAYQIVEGEYNAKGFIGYKTVDSLSSQITDPLSPTPDEIQSIAAQISTGAITLTSHELSYDSTTKEYTVDAEAGYWIVLVKGGSASKVYNPMLAGVYYTVSGSDNTMTNDPVSANESWIIEGTKAYDKSSEVTVTKKIVGGASGNENGDDVAIGDVVKYSISGNIPAYSDAYTQVTYKITDKTSDGLVLLNTTKNPVTVTVGGASVEASEGTYTLTVVDHEMTVDFTSAYALSHAGQAVEVTYFAQLTDDANTNFDANTNTAKITYSNDPTVDVDTKKTPTTDTPEDKTYHYTFELDGKLSATWDSSKVTTELTKTHMVTDEETKETKSEPLSGATFTLTNNTTGAVYEATSNTSGQLNFKGLDAGTYTLKEKSAPTGYSLNKKEIPVVISATYNENGTLKSYSVTVDGSATSTYTASYTGTNEIENIVINKVDTSIPNTPLSSLPSTGGMGTYLFTIVGIAIMAIAAGLFIVSRKRRRSL
jgi:fimbrial isopeptide formation D2 family protein/LPXTG-motif cell wall-anchored protein